MRIFGTICDSNRVETLVDKLKSGVGEVLTSERWAELLRFQAKMHRYSYLNMWLIRQQNPFVSQVASFTAWKRLGRYVRKGEISLKVLAPVVVKRLNDKTGEEFEDLVGFRLASVFDISQTDGKAVPESNLPLGTNSEAGARLETALRAAIKIPVIESDTRPALGYYDPQRDIIALHNSLDTDDRASTLLHEYVHSLLHHRDAKQVPIREQEAVAEGVSYVVCQYFGLDTSRMSFDYVAGWARNVDLVWQVGEEIQRSGRRVIAELERRITPPELPSVVWFNDIDAGDGSQGPET